MAELNRLSKDLLVFLRLQHGKGLTMIVTDNYIRSIGKHEGKGRYYSVSKNKYYSGTGYVYSQPSLFLLDAKPGVHDYLYDCVTNIGYFVLKISVVFESNEARFYEVQLMPTNELICIIRRIVCQDNIDEVRFEKNMIAERIPASFKIVTYGVSNAMTVRYSFVFQEKYKPDIGDVVIRQNNSSYTIVEVLPSGYEGFIQVNTLN